MVFLPVHKSHIDYLLITLILFCHNIKAPHIAAGNNLSIPILRYTALKLCVMFYPLEKVVGFSKLCPHTGGGIKK